MKRGTANQVVSLPVPNAAAVLMGVSACGTGRTEVTTEPAEKAAAQQNGCKTTLTGVGPETKRPDRNFVGAGQFLQANRNVILWMLEVRILQAP